VTEDLVTGPEAPNRLRIGRLRFVLDDLLDFLFLLALSCSKLFPVLLFSVKGVSLVAVFCFGIGNKDPDSSGGGGGRFLGEDG
jgi:hypothetical protein